MLSSGHNVSVLRVGILEGMHVSLPPRALIFHSTSVAWEKPPKLSGMTTILLVFQADSRHEKITNIYVGLVVRRVESH